MTMGEARVTVKVRGPLAEADIDMLVDTSATLTKVPRSIAKRVGIKTRRLVDVELADGRSEKIERRKLSS